MNANRGRQPPLLLISHGQQHEKHTIYSVSENLSHTTSIAELCPKEVLASSYGWLVLVGRYADDCCLWNPISMEIIELPNLEMSCIYSRCILTKPPTEPDCHILFNSISGLKQAFCRIGDDQFEVQFLQPDKDVQTLSAMGSFQGKIYGFVGHSYGFVAIHFVGKTLEFKPILVRKPSISRPWASWYRSYLIESPCDGELLLVRKMHSSIYNKECCDLEFLRLMSVEKLSAWS